ncbi:hypothetical protein TrST_g6698 [Triparma strigata]|uniref:C-type lectin domain-containing protein n=1 Tax=Triparma strigata TaxID=1606541 RepID=A0A9W7E3X4_9STRA|nr:hypothetical protein TrST_g6698 [Triparma strigata]
MAARYTEADVFFGTNLVDWHTARADCISQGGDLISISNAAEQAIVMNVISANGGAPSNAWIGLNDFTVEHQWDWPDSCSSNPYKQWAPGEPNNAGNEDCVEIYGSGHSLFGQWNDFYCTSQRQYLCVDAERGCPSDAPTIAPTPTPGPTIDPTIDPTQDPMRCICWEASDIVACPLAIEIYGEDATPGEFLLMNGISVLYKIVFVLFLRFVFGCRTIDLGKRSVLCFDFVPTAYLFLFLANMFLVLATYLSRCFVPLWATFYILFLHIDMVVCLADRYMNRKLKAPPPTAPPRSNLELFAYTNNKTSWRDKAYNTVELKQAKKALPAAKKMQRAKDKEDERRKSSLKNKGFSMRGAGML